MTGRVLIAGIGNIFLTDDGFGVEVLARLSRVDLPPEVMVADYGIRGMHLAYEMLDGHYHTTVLIDAVSRSGPPGTLYLIEADPDECDAAEVDAHGMHPAAVLALVRQHGGSPGRVLVLGCEPECLDEGIGLSTVVAAAVDEAVQQVRELAASLSSGSRTPVEERSESHVPGHTG